MSAKAWITRSCLALGACGVAGLVLYYTWWGTGPGVDPRPVDDSADLKLPEEERAYLWDLEHHGNLLGKYGFKALGNALSKGDAQELTALLSDSFRGRLPEKVTETKRQDDLLRLTRRSAQGAGTGGSFRSVGRESFVAQLLSFRRTFAEPPRVKLPIKHLSPHTRGDVDGPWEGQCLLRMWGTWGKGKPAEVEVVLDFEVERPTEEQGQQKGWVRGLTLRQSQVARAERFLFREVTAERGIDPGPLHDNWKSKMLRSHTGGAYLCDFDHDGRLDVLLTDLQNGFLYRGLEGGKFREVASEVGLQFRPLWRGLPLAVWADLDGDGWEDLIHGQTVWRNDHGKRFVDQTARCRLPIPLGGVTAAVADYDRDGLLDLYVTYAAPGKADSWVSGKGGGETTNRLLHNKGNWQFEDVTEKSGTGGGGLSTFAAAWLDANDDGWPDLHAINEFGDGILFINREDGTFAERRLGDHPVDFGSMGVAAGDVDNDGRIDLFVSSMYSKAGKRIFGNLRPDTYPPEVMARIHNFVKGNELHRNLGGLAFAHEGEELQVNAAGWAYGPALADLDNDGWLDIHCTAGFISRSRDKPDG